MTRYWNVNGNQQPYEEKIETLKKALQDADAVVIGAGAGLSTSAGFTYAGERFQKYFSDFAKAYGITDMYSGGFYPFPNLETYWAWWSRHIWINRYMPIPGKVYDNLLALVQDKNYFVLTTNVDHCFQRAGFDKKRLFYTQGDYGLLQSSRPVVQKTYDNEEMIRKMILAQGYTIAEDGSLTVPKGVTLKMEIPTELIPYCPDDGRPMTTNLRADDTFVQDDGWYVASKRYEDFLEKYKDGKILFLEFGVGGNTPVIIKYPFWRMTERNQNATYACVNYHEGYAPSEIADRSVVFNEDCDKVIRDLR